MTVAVFGLGFVGLTTAVCFADRGIQTYGLDVNVERRNLIDDGKLPFHEPGLGEALVRNVGKTFFVTDDVKKAVSEAGCIYYCVGTPYGDGGQADLSYLFTAIDSTLEVIRSLNDGMYRVLVTKSTIPPSTTKKKIIPHIEAKGFEVGRDLGVANNPEFLREGHCWDDVNFADRIVLGVSDDRSKELLLQLYETFSMPKFCVSLNTGEFIKYLSNTLLATMISYSNEMSIVADTIGDIDVAEAFHILHMDKRWGGCSMTSYVYPGCGYGGYCLPKDTNAIYALAKSKGFDAGILKNVIHTNDHMPEFMARRIERKICPEQTIGVLGLSFKPGSDDTRDTPAAKIIGQLMDDGYKNIIAYDPLAMEEFKKYYPFEIQYCDSKQAVVERADELAILTAWDEFKDVQTLTDKPVIDCRYML